MREGSTEEDKRYPERVGARELRQHLAAVLDSVVREYRAVYVVNKVRGGPSAAILSADALSQLVAHFTFTPAPRYDPETSQYYVTIPEIRGDGVGDTPEDAMLVLLDNVATLTEEFFLRASVYMQYDEYRAMYPYFLRLSMAADRAQMSAMLGLDLMTWPGPGDADV